NRGALFHLLKNRIYIGEIPHKAQSYPGAHSAIVDRGVFDQVQASLAKAVRRRAQQTTRVSAMALKGLIFDGEGNPMSPSFTHRGQGRIYRYYVSAPLQQGERRQDDDALRRVSAPAIEELVADALKTLAGAGAPELRSLLARVEVHPRTVQLVVRRSALFKSPGDAEAQMRTLARRLAPGQRLGAEEGGAIRMTLDCRMKLRGGKTFFVGDAGAPAPVRSRPDRKLIRALKLAHCLAAGAARAPLGAVEDLAIDVAPPSPYHRNLMRLAFLAPDLQDAILAGTQAPGLNLQGLMGSDLPPCWDDQRAAFGA
ncbi:MAG: recombinase family protein, partial [Pseudomonadota bacterium]